MTAYAVADLHKCKMSPEIVAYLEKIDATLQPFGGRYIVHGGRKTVLEGTWSGDLIIIAFPDREKAAAWYASPAYRAIMKLRRDNSEGDVILVDGVGEDHRATDILRPQAARGT
jgi:uncharacterized protein (DUF1330 family)